MVCKGFLIRLAETISRSDQHKAVAPKQSATFDLFSAFLMKEYVWGTNPQVKFHFFHEVGGVEVVLVTSIQLLIEQL